MAEKIASQAAKGAQIEFFNSIGHQHALRRPERDGSVAPKAPIRSFHSQATESGHAGHSQKVPGLPICGSSFPDLHPISRPRSRSLVVLSVVDFDHQLVGMRQQSVSAKGEHNGGAHCTVSASRLLKFAGDIGLFDMDRDCRGALQIGKLPLLAMSLSMSGTAAWSSSSLQPLGRPFAGRMSIRCIMPMSS